MEKLPVPIGPTGYELTEELEELEDSVLDTDEVDSETGPAGVLLVVETLLELALELVALTEVSLVEDAEDTE